MRASACASQGKAEGGTGRAPRKRKKKKRGGGGGGRENGQQPPDRPPTPQEMAKPPSQKAPKTGPSKGHRGTTQPKPATPSHEQRPTGKRDTQNARTHATQKKKGASNPARKKGDGGTGTTRPGTGTAGGVHHKSKAIHAKKKNTPNQPDQEARGTAETRGQHARPRSTVRPGNAGNKRGARTNTHPHTAPPTRRCRRPLGTSARAHTHTPTPPKEWRDAAETQTPARRPAPHTGNGGVQAERAGNHAPPMCKPKPKPNHKHHKPQPAKEGGRHKPYPNTPAQDPSQDWRGYLNPHPTATRMQTQTPHNSRKPSVHGLGTEAARAMQLTQSNEIRSPGVRLHPEACAALGLLAEHATPKHLGTLVPRTCMHSLGTGYARKSGEPLGFPHK